MPVAVSVVIPVYNEANLLPVALPRLLEELKSVVVPCRLLVVENGSTDGTAEVARQLAGQGPVEVISLPEPDYGAAMRHGFLLADGDWVVNFDIDYFSADFLRQILSQPEEVDLVIGSKRDPSSEDKRPLVRKVATVVFNLLLRTVLGSRVSDTHGMKGFRRGLVEEIVPQVKSTQDLFDTELVVRAERAGYRIVEVPVVVEEIRRAKSSLIRRAPRTVVGLVRMRRYLSPTSEARGGRGPRKTLSP